MEGPCNMTGLSQTLSLRRRELAKQRGRKKLQTGWRPCEFCVSVDIIITLLLLELGAGGRATRRRLGLRFYVTSSKESTLASARGMALLVVNPLELLSAPHGGGVKSIFSLHLSFGSRRTNDGQKLCSHFRPVSQGNCCLFCFIIFISLTLMCEDT